MLRIATVFSGIGAAEQALKQMGIDHKIVFACDNGERYLKQGYEELLDVIKNIKADNPEMSTQDIVKQIYDQTRRENRVKTSYFANYEIDEDRWFEDIRFLDGKPFKNQVDLFVGGSPCQSFSTFGFRKGLEDTRGTLFYDYARLVEEIQPKAFIFENVTGLLDHDSGNTWEIIYKTFISLNYKIKYQVLNAQDYNLPQLRKRVFVVGIRHDLADKEFEFPAPVPLTNKSTDYLDERVHNIYYLGKKGFEFVTQHERCGNRARINQDIIGCQTANQQFNWVGDFRMEEPEPRHYQDPRVYVGKMDGKPVVVRQMTPQELLRLMGFKDFRVIVTDRTIWRQTGNSIAVPVIKAVIEQIIKVIGE